MWRRKRALTGLDDDIRDHIAREIEDNLARGMPPDEARRQALVRFGNVTLVREDVRQVWTWGRVEQCWQDVRHAWRGVRRTPGPSVVIVITLAVGLGTITALSAAVNAVLLRPLPYRDPGALVWMDATPLSLSPSTLQAAMRDRVPSLTGLAGFNGPEPAVLSDRGQTEQVDVALVTDNLFGVLGVPPGIGRVFDSTDASPTSPAVVLLSHDYWLRRFGGDSQMLGRSFVLKGAVVTTVGVTAPGFRFPAKRGFSPAGLPVETQPDVIGVVREDRGLRVIGRLAPGATPLQSGRDLLEVHTREAASRGMGRRLLDRMAVATTPLQTELAGSDVRQRLLLALGAAGLLLLITCVNVANLLLSRASTRQSELAVRAALGARTMQLVRLLLTESLLLALLGLACGLVVASGALAAIRALLADRIAFVDVLTIDWRVMVVSVAMAVCTGVVCGLVALPAVRLRSLAARAREGHELPTHGRMRLRRILLSAQVALAVVLLVAAALLTRTFWNLTVKDAGFDARGVLTVRVSPDLGVDLGEAQAQLAETVADMSQRVAQLPGVDSVGTISLMPFAGSGPGWGGIRIEGQPPPAEGAAASTASAAITPGYFRTMGIAVVAGREFDDGDTFTAEPVAIANEAFGQRFAPRADIVNARVSVNNRLVRLVGLVNDVPSRSLREAPEPRLFIPLTQMRRSGIGFRAMTLVVRVRDGDPLLLAARVRDQIRLAGPDIVVDEVATMEERVAAALRTERDSAKVFGFFAVAALLLASIGVYGVASYFVAQRTRETGVRVALGAGRHDVNRLVVMGALKPTLRGVGCGLLTTAGLAPLLGSMVYGVAPLDPVTFVVSAAVLAVVALCAAYLPARRAMRIDPLRALRTE